MLLLKTCLLFTSALAALAADLVPSVRNKLSAGDLDSAQALVEDHARLSSKELSGKELLEKEKDYWAAMGWLARGAEMLGQPQHALRLSLEIQQKADWADPVWSGPLGAAIEVQARVLAKKSRASAIAFLDDKLKKAKANPIEARLWKVRNVLTLTGKKAPPIPGVSFHQPTLLFLWAHWCGDCKAQAPTIARLAKKFPELAIVSLTRSYAEHPGNDKEEEAEQKSIAEVWTDTYKDLPGQPLVDKATMIRYGVSSTPTLALVDKRGIVRAYHPTRLSEARPEQLVSSILRNPAKQ